MSNRYTAQAPQSSRWQKPVLSGNNGRNLSPYGVTVSLMPYARLILGVVLLLSVVYCASQGNRLDLLLIPLSIIAVLMLLLNLGISIARRQRWFVDSLVPSSLVLDTVLLTALIYFTGGATNPLTVLYILPIINAALLCSPRFARILTGVIVLCYLLLFFEYRSFSLFEHDMSAHHGHSHGHDQGGDHAMMFHLIGMWITFSFSAVLAMLWISRLVQTVQAHEKRLQQAYQRQQEDEYWLVMGLQTAATAHELSTPLNNLELIYEELKHTEGLPATARADVELMTTQLSQAKRSLSILKRMTPPQEQRIWLYREMAERLSAWRNLRPDIHWQWQRDPQETASDYEVILHESFWYAFFNILNNAADAGNHTVQLLSSVSSQGLFTLSLYNPQGHLSEAQLEKAGLDMIESDKPFGFGLGVRLAHASLSRLGGSLELGNRDEGGVRAVIQLPLQLLSEVRE